MKSLRLTLLALPLALTGCSTLSSVNWSAANPWNWFGSSTEVTEQGVGALTAATLLTLMAIITLFLKSMLQWRLENQEKRAQQEENHEH